MILSRSISQCGMFLVHMQFCKLRHCQHDTCIIECCRKNIKPNLSSTFALLHSTIAERKLYSSKFRTIAAYATFVIHEIIIKIDNLENHVTGNIISFVVLHRVRRRNVVMTLLMRILAVTDTVHLVRASIIS